MIVVGDRYALAQQLRLIADMVLDSSDILNGSVEISPLPARSFITVETSRGDFETQPKSPKDIVEQVITVRLQRTV
jgi:hypothetical protein